MSRQLKHLAMQVIVITGATSRIGLATARMASRQGATLVLAASNATTLERLATEIRQAGGDVLAVPVDSGSQEQVAALGQAALQQFGRIDTWINAGMAWGDIDEVKPTPVAVRLFRSHYLGATYGASVAAELMRQEGGAIINLDSDASARHGVKGWTDVLRADLESASAPISVTLVHAASAVSTETHHAPRWVAEAILHAAQYPQRDVVAGSGPRVAPEAASVQVPAAPRLVARVREFFTARQPQKALTPAV
jgi:NAD(P)-dependent dehydrogenase (short-subunit alcohol dehydrogenase family)